MSIPDEVFHQYITEYLRLREKYAKELLEDSKDLLQIKIDLPRKSFTTGSLPESKVLKTSQRVDKVIDF